jgi:hypothetical protein
VGEAREAGAPTRSRRLVYIAYPASAGLISLGILLVTLAPRFALVAGRLTVRG